MANPAPAQSVLDARSVPGTPLTLVHWWRYGQEPPNDDGPGARFTLIDLTGKPVWMLDLPKDYSLPQNEEAQAKLTNEIQSAGAILDTTRPGRFDLRFAAEGKRVTFAVRRGADGAWHVRETGRRPYATPPVSWENPPKVPETSLNYLGAVTLQTPPRQKPPGVDRILGDPPNQDRLGEVAAVAIDPRGRIYVATARTGGVHVFDPSGRPLYVCRPDPTDFGADPRSLNLSVADTGDVYLTTFEGRGKFLHFSPEGKRLGFEQLGAERSGLGKVSDQWLPRPGGAGGWGLDGDNIRLVDGKGAVIRAIERGPDDNWLQFVSQGAVGPDGSLIVFAWLSLHGLEKWDKLHLYNKAGGPLRTLALPLPINASASLAYDGERVAVPIEGGVLLVKASGSVEGQFRPTQGRAGEGTWHPFLPANQKQLWLYDGQGTMHRYALP